MTTSVLDPANKALSLVIRKNLKDNEGKRIENLARINKVTGRDFSFDFEGDLQKLNDSLESGYKDRVGDFLFAKYLENIAYMLEENFKDDLIKEAFLEQVTQNKIVVRGSEQPKPSGADYQKFFVENGVFVVETYSDCFAYNLSDISYIKLEKFL